MIGIIEFLEQLALDFSNNPFSNDTGTPEKNVPPLDEVDEGKTFYTCSEIHFFSSYSPSTDVSNISDITLNTAS